MKRVIKIMLYLTPISLLFFLSKFELQAINNPYIRTFWHNLKFLASALYILIPLFLLLIFSFLLFTNKCALQVEKMSIGGFNILFDNPVHLYKNKLKFFLDTKRTIFKIDFEHDNFSETLDSYYEIYIFFRDEIKILRNIKKQWLGKNDAEKFYNLTNQAIVILNTFLTEYQSNYRRWYTYIEKTDTEKYYLTPIGELQKEYPYYEKLCCGFTEVNKFFKDEFAVEFEVDFQKWKN